MKILNSMVYFCLFVFVIISILNENIHYYCLLISCLFYFYRCLLINDRNFEDESDDEFDFYQLVLS